MLVGTTCLTTNEQILLNVTYGQLLGCNNISPEVLQLQDQADLCDKMRKIRFQTSLESINIDNGTSKLWLQYMTMFEIMLNFIRSDRTGSFTGNMID